MTHMKLCNRQRLGFLAELEWTMRRIAEDRGWSAQTKPKKNDFHPTMKPFEMLCYLVGNSWSGETARAAML